MKRQKYSNLDTPSNTASSSRLVRCHFSKISSTQTYLINWVSKTPPPEFSVVSADVQTGGRGQYGRQWADWGGNVAMSIVVYPEDLQADQQFLLQLWSAISIYDALVAVGINEYRLRIKWPNDILIDGRKLAGILLQSSISGSFIRHGVIGIGINVRAAPTSLPNVCSLAQEHIYISPSELREKVLFHLYQAYEDMKFDRGVASYRDLYHKRLWNYRKEVDFIIDNKRSQGRILGINSLGHLELECDGEIRTVTGSEVLFER